MKVNLYEVDAFGNVWNEFLGVTLLEAQKALRECPDLEVTRSSVTEERLIAAQTYESARRGIKEAQ